MKRTIMVALVAIVLISSVFATTEFKFNVGLRSSKELGTNMDIEIKGNNGKVSGNPTVNLDTEFDIFFKDGLGMNILFGTEKFSTYNVGVGFAYNLEINKNWDFLITVGPVFSISGGSDNKFGLFSHFDFDFIAGRYFYARIGTGLDLNFLTFGDGKTETGFEMLIPIPRVAIGWKF